MPRILYGQTLTYEASPFADGPLAARHERRGAVLVEGGYVTQVGPADQIKAPPKARAYHYGEALIMAGFVDAHVHYPQTAMIASWGKRLIDWLNDYTFPEEIRLADPEYATEIAARYFDLAIAHGTTSMASFATSAPTSVDAFFTQAQRRNMRALAGKTCMDRNAPEPLCDTAQSAYDDSKALLETWHGRDRLGYAITPRFAPTSTPDQLTALAALWAEHPDCLMQTHLSEQIEEIAWVQELFPGKRDYLDIYEQFGLLGPHAVFGHAIHLEPRERARLRETGAALVHCPTSNTFIGSGLFDMRGRITDGLRIGLATDTGGGSSFSMLRTMAAAYEISQLQGSPLHPSELIWLATCGSAEALHLSDKIGNLAPGMEADLIVLNLSSTAAISQRYARAEDLWDAVFPTIMMGDDRAIDAVWIAGQPV